MPNKMIKMYIETKKKTGKQYLMCKRGGKAYNNKYAVKYVKKRISIEELALNSIIAKRDLMYQTLEKELAEFLFEESDFPCSCDELSLATCINCEIVRDLLTNQSKIRRKIRASSSNFYELRSKKSAFINLLYDYVIKYCVKENTRDLERLVKKYLKAGFSEREIAVSLKISRSTIRKYKKGNISR